MASGAGDRDAMKGRRSRPLVLWFSLIALAVALGLGSRSYAGYLPYFIAAYAGDTLWALVAFLGLGLLLPGASAWLVGLLAVLFAFSVEISQLYHAPWIDSIRRTRLGGLLLGFDFVWSDLACYAVGVGLGILIELAMARVRRGRPAGSLG